METRRGHVPVVLMSVLVGAVVGALLARWVFRETDLWSVLLIAGAAAAASGVGAVVRGTRRARRPAS
jgi:uncharacterized membrane protein YoaK (UPF0700 family)